MKKAAEYIEVSWLSISWIWLLMLTRNFPEAFLEEIRQFQKDIVIIISPNLIFFKHKPGEKYTNIIAEFAPISEIFTLSPKF